MAAHTDVAVGIDVAKAQLDIVVEPTGTTWTVPRSRGGLRRLQEQLQALRPTRIVLEASGGYERLVVATLAAAGLPVVVVNPRQTHDCARALGRLAKTDRLDAQVLARFAAEVRPPVRPQPSQVVEDLQILSRRRRQLVNDRAAEQQRRRHDRPHLDLGFDALAAARTAALAKVDRQLAALVQAEPTLRARAAWLRSIPGIGPVAVATLLAEVPELGRCSRQEVAAPRRGGALQPRQRRLARAPQLLGWARPGARRALHGRPDGRPPQPPPPRLLSAPHRRRQAGQGGPRRLHAQVACPLQRPLPRPHPVGPHHGLTLDTQHRCSPRSPLHFLIEHIQPKSEHIGQETEHIGPKTRHIGQKTEHIAPIH